MLQRMTKEGTSSPYIRFTQGEGNETPLKDEKGFLGAHSNVGGGYPNNDLSDGALLW